MFLSLLHLFACCNAVTIKWISRICWVRFASKKCHGILPQNCPPACKSFLLNLPKTTVTLNINLISFIGKSNCSSSFQIYFALKYFQRNKSDELLERKLSSPPLCTFCSPFCYSAFCADKCFSWQHMQCQLRWASCPTVAWKCGKGACCILGGRQAGFIFNLYKSNPIHQKCSAR